jgi:hypothetical protein
MRDSTTSPHMIAPVSNPFTRSITALLRCRNTDTQVLLEFVRNWDALESLVIRACRGKTALDADRAEHARIAPWLRENYPKVCDALEPRWRASRVGTEAPSRDPFAALLAVESADAFVDNWEAMRQLPAAREALNQLVVDESGERPA